MRELRTATDDLQRGSLNRRLREESGAFLRLVRQDFPENSPWEIRVTPPDYSLRFVYKKDRFSRPTFDFTIHERGIALESDAVHLHLNIFEAEDENPDSISPVPERSKGTYIHLNVDNADKLGLPAPVVVIDATPSVTGSGTVQLHHTESSRSLQKSGLAEELSPRPPAGMSTQAAYDKNGTLRYVRIIFIDNNLPGPNHHHRTVRAVYDLRHKSLESGIRPDLAFLRSQGTYDFEEYPQIEVDHDAGTFTVSYQGNTDEYPIQAPTALELVRTAAENIKEALPPFSGDTAQLPEGALGLSPGPFGLPFRE